MIEEYRFGCMVVLGIPYMRDLKIINGQVISDWWRKEGHLVGVEDVQDILAAKPDVLVLGSGDPGQMRTTDELRQALKEKGIELIEEGTARAIESFNLCHKAGGDVAAGFHLTC